MADGLPLVVLGHGASGSAASMAPWVEALGGHGIAARAIDLPKGRAERALPAFLAAVAEPGSTVMGGHSFGGRVASLAAAQFLADGPPVAGLLLLSYPLHHPGRPESWRERTAHWPALTCPVLLLSGDADPFARPALLREAVAQLPHGRLVTYPRVGHGLLPVLDEAASEAAVFVRLLAAA